VRYRFTRPTARGDAASGARPRRAGVATVVLVAAVTAGCGGGDGAVTPADPGTTPSSPAPASSLSPTDPSAYAAEIIAETDRARAAAGLPALTGSDCAQAAALPRAEALVGRPDLEHAPMDAVLTACAPRTTAAENLSRAAATPAQIVDAWLGSYGHRENLLDPQLTDVGVACVRDDDAMLCAQIFLGP
jgi:uncharacterized protein YkwD